jgi:hypothetical protein
MERKKEREGGNVPLYRFTNGLAAAMNISTHELILKG